MSMGSISRASSCLQVCMCMCVCVVQGMRAEDARQGGCGGGRVCVGAHLRMEVPKFLRSHDGALCVLNDSVCVCVCVRVRVCVMRAQTQRVGVREFGIVELSQNYVMFMRPTREIFLHRNGAAGFAAIATSFTSLQSQHNACSPHRFIPDYNAQRTKYEYMCNTRFVHELSVVLQKSRDGCGRCFPEYC